ncbi:MAG: cell wall hydrolase [Candidatus Acidiferrales bacterium]
MIEYDLADAHSCSLCAWKEARGDGNMAMRAVLHVIANRVGAPGFGKTVHDVVYGKNQFSSMSIPSDPEFNLAPANDDVQFAYCSGLVDAVLQGTDEDITNGARYYDNPKTAASGWFKRVIVDQPAIHPLVYEIGKQKFYR